MWNPIAKKILSMLELILMKTMIPITLILKCYQRTQLPFPMVGTSLPFPSLLIMKFNWPREKVPCDINLNCVIIMKFFLHFFREINFSRKILPQATWKICCWNFFIWKLLHEYKICAIYILYLCRFCHWKKF